MEMELTQTQQHGVLEDLLVASKGESYWTTFHGDYQIFPSNWNSDLFHDHGQDLSTTTNSSGLGLVSPASGYAFPLCEQCPYLDGLTNIPVDEFDSSFDDCKPYPNLPSIPFQEEREGVVENAQAAPFGQRLDASEDCDGSCKVEEEPPVSAMASKMDLFGEQKSQVLKKVERQPSKNLMAERRRRKRLNDRLSMLRSIVPKISKMDRTSILGGTIDYIKDLLDKIYKLRCQSMDDENTNQMNATGNLKELKPDEVLAAGNPPKFDVERRSVDTRIELCCTSKPGLLLSTLSTLEALGLDVQQCVISSFNDFSLQANCSEVAEHRRIIGSEDVKQALFRNAGYGGRCL